MILQHSPSSSYQADFPSEIGELRERERFREYISNVFVHWDICQSSLAALDSFSNEVIADVDMLRSCMELVVLCECYCALIIRVKGDRVSEFGCDFTKKLSNPKDFFHCVHLSNVFGLCA